MVRRARPPTHTDVWPHWPGKLPGRPEGAPALGPLRSIQAVGGQKPQSVRLRRAGTPDNLGLGLGRGGGWSCWWRGDPWGAGRVSAHTGVHSRGQAATVRSLALPGRAVVPQPPACPHLLETRGRRRQGSSLGGAGGPSSEGRELVSLCKLRGEGVGEHRVCLLCAHGAQPGWERACGAGAARLERAGSKQPGLAHQHRCTHQE